MTDDEMELAQIARDIDDARGRLTLFRRLLVEQLAPHGATYGLVDDLIAGCDEFGAEATITFLATSPEQYNLTALPNARMAVVGPLIAQLADASYDFDRMVVAREHILCRQDPNRNRVYPSYGQELVLDRQAMTMRAIHPPSDPEPLDIVAVPNRAAPKQGPDVDKTPARRRRKDKDR